MCSPEALARRYLSVLIDQLGLDAHPIDPDTLTTGVLIHRRGLKLHLANHAPNDPEYLQLTCHLSLEDHTPDQIAAAAHHNTARFKAIKIYPTPTGAVLAAEQFVAAPDSMPSPAQLVAVLPRTLRALDHAHDIFLTDLAFRVLTDGLALGPPTTTEREDA